MTETKFAGLNRRAARGFAYLLAVMFLFTAVSRAADSFLVPQVEVEEPAPKVIEHLVETAGWVENREEFPVLTEAGLLVETVCVQEGAFVQEGDILARLMKEWIAEQMDVLKNEIAALRLANEAVAENAARTKLEWERQRERAGEDYARIVKEQEAAVAQAETELNAAQTAIDSFREQEQADALYQAYFAKKAAYEAALSAQESAVTAAERAVLDAQNEAPLDNTAKINQITIKEKEKALSVLAALYDSGGEIRAPKAGTVTGVFIETGLKTADTAAFTMASAEDGIRFAARIAQEDMGYVQIGDAVSIKKNGKTYDGFTVTDIEAKSDGGAGIWAETSGGSADFLIGDTVTLTVRRQSERYPLAVSLAAVHMETQGAYVYVLREEETVLGTELFAEKVPVKILEKNGSYAALEEGTLGAEDRVITDSDRYIEAGSRVRLKAS